MKDSVIYNCLTKGDFLLHSGRRSKYLFDVMKLIRNERFLNEFYEFIKENKKDFVVGIEFGGSILASIDAGYQKDFAIIRKDGIIYGSPIPKDYVLFDDVVTTENSIRVAMEQIYKQIGYYPKEIKCIVDRRNKDNKSLHIESMLEWEE